MKKILTSLLLVFALFLVSCTKEVDTLPDLSNKTIEEIDVILEKLGLYGTYEYDEGNNDYPDMSFIKYLDFNVGDKVEDLGTREVRILIAVNSEASIKLPNLSGLNKQQVEQELKRLFITYEFEYIEDDSKEADSFASYVGFNAGDSFVSSNKLTVNLYTNTFLNDSESLFISKYWDGGENHQGIEIYNPTNKSVDLKDYKLVILSDGSLTPTAEIALEGTLERNQTFLVVNPSARREVVLKANIRDSKVSFDGNDTIQLRYKNNTYIDLVGNLGASAFSMTQELFVRNENIKKGSRTFVSSEWAEYVPTYYAAFDTFPLAKPVNLEIDMSYLAREFGNPLGGMLQVTLQKINDGDTAGFNPGHTDGKRVRFLGIDTPETYPIVEPGGLEAKAFTTQMLENAEVIYLQSDPYLGHIDNYGRGLGYIWIDGQLLNYLLVLNGHSLNNIGRDSKLVYGNRYIYRWFEDAEDYARENKLGIHAYS